MFCILTLDGCRAGEVLGLKWGDIDFDRSLLHIRARPWYGKHRLQEFEASGRSCLFRARCSPCSKKLSVTWKA